MKYFVGLDLGTQSAKGMLFDPYGKVVAIANAEYFPEFPQPGWAEMDVSVWEKAFIDIINQFTAYVPKEEIGTITFASLCGDIVPVDNQGNALSKCILWLDKRAADQCDSVRRYISDDEAFHLIGSTISASVGAMKIMWIKKNQPQVYKRARAFLDVGEYMVYWLTGELVSDYAHASITGLYDINTREYSKKMLDITGIDESKLKPVKSGFAIAGQVTAKMAALTGLSTSTKITVGSGDQHVCVLGSGLIGTGKIVDIIGTTEVVATASERPVFDKHKVLKPHLHVNPKYWQIEQGGMLTGGALRWCRDNILGGSFDDINQLAMQAPAGANGLIFLPSLQGSAAPVLNDNAKGTFYGLTMGHGRPEIARAVLEGCAYGFRDNLESMIDMGIGAGSIVAGGGGSKSAVWMQLKADLIGREIVVMKEENSTVLGAGMISGVAQGNFKSFEEAAEQLIAYGPTYYPNLENRARYDEMYQAYRELYFHLEPMFNRPMHHK